MTLLSWSDHSAVPESVQSCADTSFEEAKNKSRNRPSLRICWPDEAAARRIVKRKSLLGSAGRTVKALGLKTRAIYCQRHFPQAQWEKPQFCWPLLDVHGVRYED